VKSEREREMIEKYLRKIRTKQEPLTQTN